MRIVRRGFLCFLVAAVAVGCTASPPASDQRQSSSRAQSTTGSTEQKRFVAAIRGFPKSVSPTIDAAGAGSTAGVREVGQLVNSGLSVAGGDGRLAPRMSESVPSLENGLWKLFPDGTMETTWKLRAGAQWHDGAPFTAEDLAFTTRVAQDPTLTIAIDPAVPWIESVHSPDPQTFIVRWKQPYISADAFMADLSSTSVLPMPKHLLETTFLEDRPTFTVLPYWGEHFVGTGPFKVKEFVADSHLVLAANDRFVLGRPKIDEIEVRFIGDFNVLVANVLAGAVEMNFGRGLSLEQAQEARHQWTGGRIEVAVDNTTALFPQFVNANPVAVTDVRFRRALLHAIDRQQITDTLQAGLSPVAESPLNPANPDAREVDSRLVRYPYDPNRARQILEEMGYMRGPDGYYHDRAGQRLTPKIQTTVDDLRQKTAAVIGDYWKESGAFLDLVLIPRQLSSDRAVRSEFATFDFTRQPSDPTRYHSAQAPLLENNYRGNNRGRYQNSDLDALIERYQITIPRGERLQIMGNMVHHMTDRLVTMGIFYVVEAILVSNRLANVGPPIGEEALQTWNAHEWDVKAP